MATKTRHLPLEKLILALVVAARKLMHYFQALTIKLVEDKKEAHKLRNKPLRYYLDPHNKLYKKSLSEPYLEYVHLDLVEDFLAEIHCGAHTGGRSLTHRAVT
ncbi:hypothetical protein HYC85_029191 [Camellia sinensis]|uniref:Uncharacterized protein n=1 Tax=Camellia sinensis TaxID=4442 RepID=A0A7J7FXA0_CAMSI|nr:hypothetical protein HYC85_029191 [Camellia sinensis]